MARAKRNTAANRIRPALLAFACMVLAAFVASTVLERWEGQYLARMATTGEDEVVKGMALTRMALDRPDMLVLMGSSELTFQDDYHPARLFAGQPDGFSVYVVGSGYRQSIHQFLTIAAMGSQASGKPLVLFLSPSWFSKTIADKAYQKNFSLLQAYEFAFSSPLSPSLKARAARRLLALGRPVTDDTLLHTALASLAGADPGDRVRYALLWPLGRAELAELRLKDQIDLLRYILKHRVKPAAPSTKTASLDWDALTAKATVEAKAMTDNNDFGIQRDYYSKYVAPHLPELKDSATSEDWSDSSEYGDLSLVLDALQELHAKPMFVSLPVLGTYYDYKGHPVADRQAYYQRVRQQIQRLGFPVVDFGNKEYEPGFLRDPWHPGWKGALAIDQALVQFHRGTLPDTYR
ncbi:MAG: D-alanyl-lipoteichoic acid biosynthesis protein DltD [Mycobacterium leprae]